MTSIDAQVRGRRTAALALGLTSALLLAVSPAAALPWAKPKPKAPAAPPPPPKPTAADWRPVDPDNLLVIDTNKGRVLVALAPELAPEAVARVQTLARQHFYDGLTFFRVVDQFMDQTGDPKNTGEGGSTLPDLKGEFAFRRSARLPFAPVTQPDGATVGFIGFMPVSSQPEALMGMTNDGSVNASGLFCPGVAGMARAGSPDSANSQFFLMRATYSSLNGKYAAFGRVLVGEAVVKDIKVGEPVAAPQDVMTKVRLASDMPEAERPKIKYLDPRSAAFKGVVDKVSDEEGADFSICDVDIPVQTS
jgi:peptidylprolyl isomerase